MITNRLNRNNNTSRDRLNGDRTMFLARVSGSMVLIFSKGSSMGWAAPSYAQFLNLVMALTMEARS